MENGKSLRKIGNKKSEKESRGGGSKNQLDKVTDKV
jgi:hypothetical protein